MILLKNGDVVSDKEVKKLDVLFDEKLGRIVNVVENIANVSYEEIDCTGKLLFPGFIDAHTHFDLSVAGTTTIDGFSSGTKAAIAGGTTTIIDYASQYEGETLMEAYKNWENKAAEGCYCDYGFHMSIADIKNNQLQECKDMIYEGLTTFKLYMTYDVMLNDEDLYKTLLELKKLGAIAGVHCENAGIIEALRDKLIEEDPANLRRAVSHVDTRPPEVEAEALNRLLYMAKLAKVPVVAVHTTCKESLNEIRKARENGVKVYIETCPHYLCLTRDVFDKTPDNFYETSKYVCAPVLRQQKDVDCLWEAIRNGEIDTIATDHCSFTTEQKRMGENDFRKIPGGLNGVESRAELIYEEGVVKGRIDLPTMCKILSTNAANIYGLYNKKGYISIGFDADIVIFDPNKPKTFSIDNQVSKSDYCAYEGKTVSGSIDTVFLRGKEVVRDGEVLEEKHGEFLRRLLPRFYR